MFKEAIFLVLLSVCLPAAGETVIAQKRNPGAGKRPVKSAAKTPKPAEAAKTPHAALAIDRKDGFYYGFSFDHPSTELAEQRALDECTKRGGNCSVVLSWAGTGCGAYRTVESKVGTAWGWGVGATKESADAIATAEATRRSGGRSVPNFAFACNSASTGALDVIRDNGMHSNDINALVFSADGKTLVSGSHDKSAKLWDLARGNLIRTIDAPVYINNVFFLAGDTQLGIVAGNTVFIHDVTTGKEVRKSERQSSGINRTEITSDKNTLLTEDYFMPAVSRWNVATLTKTATFKTGPTHEMAFSRDGQYAVFDTKGGGIVLMNTVSGATVRTLEGHRPGDWPVVRLAISPDNRLIASAEKTRVTIWDAATGAKLRSFGDHKDRHQALGFSPDGKLLATAANDAMVKLWDVGSGTLVHTLAGHEGWVQALAFSPDGKMLASGAGNKDSSIFVWDVASGKALRTFSKN